MRAFLVVFLCLAAPLAAAAPPAPEPLPAGALEPAPTPELRLLAATAAALGGAGGVLLSFPLAVPMIYVAALVGLPAAAGALPLLLAVPLFAALGSGGVALAFSSGIGPWLTGALAGGAAGVTALLVGAVVAPQRPGSLLDLHVGVLSVVGVPSLAAAATAALVLPFFVTGGTRGE